MNSHHDYLGVLFLGPACLSSHFRSPSPPEVSQQSDANMPLFCVATIFYVIEFEREYQIFFRMMAFFQDQYRPALLPLLLRLESLRNFSFQQTASVHQSLSFSDAVHDFFQIFASQSSEDLFCHVLKQRK